MDVLMAGTTAEGKAVSSAVMMVVVLAGGMVDWMGSWESTMVAMTVAVLAARMVDSWDDE